MNRYFVTGATGVVGSAVVHRLLERSDAELVLLIRGESDADVERRRRRVVALGERRTEEALPRVRALRGDTTLAHFGLPSEVYANLRREVTHIVHSAAMVRMNLPLDDARRSAVTAAVNVTELAHRCADAGQLQKVEVLSTVGIAGRRPGALCERWIQEPRTFHNTYEQAKAEAETHLETHCRNGLPMTIHRPSMVVGDSRTGRIASFQIFYHLAEFLSGARTFGVFPALGDARLDIVPVDYVADAVAWSSEQSTTSGRVLHLCSGPSGSVRLADLQLDVRRAWREAGRRLPPAIALPRSIFGRLIPVISAVAPHRIRKALATLPIFLDYLADTQAFENRETLALLGASGMRLPAAEAYLPKVLDAYLRRPQIPPTS